jgi:preprotein translocase subunit SecF
MAKEIDRARTRAMKQTVAAHPGMVLFALAPAVVVFGVLWIITNFWIALIVGVVAGGATLWKLLSN